MSDSIPMWWLVISGASFLLNAVLFAVLIYAALKMIPALQTLAAKVNEITAKVDTIASKVDAIAEDVRQTATSVRGGTTSILGHVESVASTASHQFERLSPILAAAMTVYRVAKAVREARAARKQDPDRPALQRPKKK